MSFLDCGRKSAIALGSGLLLLSQRAQVTIHAEDAETFRPYLQLRSGALEISRVQDAWGIGVGANINKYLGFQLDFDAFERQVKWPGLGEIAEDSIMSLTPEIRVRYPLGGGRWVPYAYAGPGVTFFQLNDRKEPAYHHQLSGDSIQFSVAAGVGLEYYVADNISFSVEAKYDWIDSDPIKFDGERRKMNYSSPLIFFGVRAYFRENHHQPILTENDPQYPSRFWGGFRYGSSILVDKRMNSDLYLRPVAAALGGTGNQSGSFLLGYNFGRHWGVGLTTSYAEYDIGSDRYGGIIGEYANYSLTPEVRWHWTLWDGKLAPFITAGMGVSYSEFNDRKTAGAGLLVDGKNVTPTAVAGGGAEYFFARNLSVSAESYYLTSWDHKITVNGRNDGAGSYSAVNFYLGLRFYLTEH